MIIGVGGVADVAAHKCAQNNDVLGNIVIASKTLYRGPATRLVKPSRAAWIVNRNRPVIKPN